MVFDVGEVECAPKRRNSACTLKAKPEPK